MKNKISKWFPFHGFTAMTFFNIIVWREEYIEHTLYNEKYSKITINHESIHEAQMRDFCRWIPIGGIIFYMLYFGEWVGRLFINGPAKAYRNISFEREAFTNEYDMEYLIKRKRFAMWKK